MGRPAREPIGEPATARGLNVVPVDADSPRVSVVGRTLATKMSPLPGALRPLARALIDLALATIAEEREDEKEKAA